MKTVTDKFVSAQAAPDAVFVRQVYYKRRYWNPTTRVYVWESSWTLLPEYQIQSISPIQWQLDNDQLNEFKVSNVTIVADNSDNRWRLDSKDGFFKQDSVSPVYGYEPYWTKFQVKTGFVLADGTSETLAIFTGLATEYTMDSQSKVCQINIDGLEALLINAKAEAICTTVTLENMGTGDGSNKDFTTLNPGVSAFSLVSKAGITQVEGKDFTVSQTNDATLGGKISFIVAPDVGNVIKATYIYWPQGLQFHEIVEALLTAGGIASINQIVEPATFGNSVINTQTYTTEANWETGTMSIMESTSTPGSMKINWEDDTDLLTDPSWVDPNTGTGWTDMGGNRTRYRSQVRGMGIWDFDFAWKTSATAVIGFAITSLNSGYDTMDGYKLVVTNNGGNALFTLKYNSTSLGTFNGVGINAVDYYIRIVRTGDGVIKVYAYWDYFGGGQPAYTLKITASDPSPATVSSYFAFSYADSPGSNQATMGTQRPIHIPFSTVTASWTSATIDMTATPTAWGTFTHLANANNATLVYQTRTSTDGISWDAWTTISGSDLPQSTLKRYAQIRCTIAMDSTVQIYPEILEIDFRWITSSSTVTLPNFTGVTIYEAIQKIGEFTNYEFGFNPDETFFFRPKSTGSSVMTLTQSDYLSQITGMDSGFSRVYGIVRATYGTIVKEITDDAAFASSPLARVTNKRFEISPDSNIQIPATADIATGVASSFYAFLSKQRRRLKARAKFIPQLDLSDVVTVDLINNPPDKQWFLGDPGVYLGQPDTQLWGEDQQIVKGFLGKVIAARYDTSGRNCEFELEEVV